MCTYMYVCSFGTTPSTVKDLFLAFCSGTTPGGVQGTIYGTEDQTGVGHMQRIYLNPCSISLALQTCLFLR